MPGLDQRILRQIDHQDVIEHVKADIRSDFILAPHYNVIFNRVGDELWDQLQQQLRAGNYEPDLPITISVPKERWFSRPGSILKPYDRFLYQALADHVTTQLEDSLDRERTFSHVPSNDADKVFEPNHQSWERFQRSVFNICDGSSFLLKADISHYFERLPQHHLINLMTATECAPEAVRLLEEMLSAFRERNSFGIIQGVFPSDLFGNFFLSDFDAYCEIQNIPSARYVDDIYMGFETEIAARRGLGRLIERLRQDGLQLNEFKTSIMPSDDVVQEETAIDRLFDEIRDELEDDQNYERTSPYGFEAEWDEDEDDEDDDEEGEEDEVDIENAAVERLMVSVGDYPEHIDQIEKFCLPILRSANSDSAVQYVIDNLQEKPHQTRLYFSYLTTFVRSNQDVTTALEGLIDVESAISDYQKMFLLAVLLRAPTIGRPTVNAALQWLHNQRLAKEARAMAAIFAARHGTATQKRAVRTSYEDEPSNYVRSAILYSARHFTPADRRTCKRAWGAHDQINALISRAI